jgi:plasmid stability protein
MATADATKVESRAALHGRHFGRKGREILRILLMAVSVAESATGRVANADL